MTGDVPAGQDQLPQIDTAPAHDAIAREIGAGFNQGGQLGFLLRVNDCARQGGVNFGGI